MGIASFACGGGSVPVSMASLGCRFGLRSSGSPRTWSGWERFKGIGDAGGVSVANAATGRADALVGTGCGAGA
jgi:hypothetical protein